MLKFLFTILLSSILISIIDTRTYFPTQSTLEVNGTCVSNSGARGVCILITECSGFQDLLHRPRSLKICGWFNGIQPIVCCTNSPPTSTSATPKKIQTQKPKAKQTLSCGKRKPVATLYVVGGRQANSFAWPWIAALYTRHDDYQQFCAASILNERFLLTAAHCLSGIDDEDDIMVGVGSNNLNNTIKYEVSRFIIHPQYRRELNSNDIALIRLVKTMKFSDSVQPICLPDGIRYDVDDDLMTAGWGTDSYQGKSRQLLQETTLNLVDFAKCNATYSRQKSSKLPRGLNDGMICANSETSVTDTCQGDSGGALIKLTPDKTETDVKWEARYHQIGIVSFGRTCADKDFPGVYTKVEKYINWIRSHIEPRKSQRGGRIRFV